MLAVKVCDLLGIHLSGICTVFLGWHGLHTKLLLVVNQNKEGPLSRSCTGIHFSPFHYLITMHTQSPILPRGRSKQIGGSGGEQKHNRHNHEKSAHCGPDDDDGAAVFSPHTPFFTYSYILHAIPQQAHFFCVRIQKKMLMWKASLSLFGNEGR